MFIRDKYMVNENNYIEQKRKILIDKGMVYNE